MDAGPLRSLINTMIRSGYPTPEYDVQVIINKLEVLLRDTTEGCTPSCDVWTGNAGPIDFNNPLPPLSFKPCNCGACPEDRSDGEYADLSQSELLTLLKLIKPRSTT